MKESTKEKKLNNNNNNINNNSNSDNEVRSLNFVRMIFLNFSLQFMTQSSELLRKKCYLNVETCY